MADNHFHPCSKCQQPAECSLEGVGSCSPPYLCESCRGAKRPNLGKHSQAGVLLPATWLCVNGCGQWENSEENCPTCDEAKPKAIGTCSECSCPISEYYPTECWFGHAFKLPQLPSLQAELCGSCKAPLEEGERLKEFGGEMHCPKCWPTCSDCGETLDEGAYIKCHYCGDLYCPDCSSECQCCGRSNMCRECGRENHGIY